MDGQHLKSVRTKHRLNQKELAAYLNAQLSRSYDDSNVSRWESGRTKIPDNVAEAVETLAQSSPPKADAKIIALANHKGGVAKTTSAINLAAALAHLGQRVLLVDLDPQHTATRLSGLNPEDLIGEGKTIYHLLYPRGRAIKIEDVIQKASSISGAQLSFHIIASQDDLKEIEREGEAGVELVLAEILEPIRTVYDFIVIDTPPQIGKLASMALCSASDVIIPVETETAAVLGLALMFKTIATIKRRLNPKLVIMGILPTKFQKGTTVHRQMLEGLITDAGYPVLAPVVSSVAFKTSQANLVPAVEAFPDAKGVDTYNAIARALVNHSPMPLASGL